MPPSNNDSFSVNMYNMYIICIYVCFQYKIFVSLSKCYDLKIVSYQYLLSQEYFRKRSSFEAKSIRIETSRNWFKMILKLVDKKGQD